jgi:hypothetical protein
MKRPAAVALLVSCIGCEVAAPPASPAGEEKPRSEFATDDLAARVEKARTGVTDPDARARELLEIRREVLRRRDAMLARRHDRDMQESRRKARAPGEPEDAMFGDETSAVLLPDDMERVLNAISVARAEIFAAQGKQAEALRESMPRLEYLSRDTWVSPRFMYCDAKDEPCVALRASVEKTWPSLCTTPKTSDVCWTAIGQPLDYLAEQKTAHFLSFVVTKVTKRTDGGFDLVGADFDPSKTEVCEGEFKTNRITDVNERRIVIEQTTWCRAIKQKRVSGFRATYRVGALPFEPTRGDRLLLLVEPKQIKLGKTGAIETALVDKPLVLQIDGRKSAWVWNDVERRP